MSTVSSIHIVRILSSSYAIPMVLLGLVLATLLGGVRTSVAADPAAERLIVANQQCNPDGQVKVSFSWQTASQGNQWLDLSRTPDNFQSGALISVGPLTSQQTAADADGLGPVTAYYARVNTQIESGWSAGSTLSFSTRACDAGAAGSAGGGGDGSAGSGGDGGGGGYY